MGDKDSQNAIVEPKGVKPIGVSSFRQKRSVTAVDKHLCCATTSKYVLDVLYIVKAMYQAGNTKLTVNYELRAWHNKIMYECTLSVSDAHECDYL